MIYVVLCVTFINKNINKVNTLQTKLLCNGLCFYYLWKQFLIGHVFCHLMFDLYLTSEVTNVTFNYNQDQIK